MAKSQAKTTIAPELFTFSRPIIADGAARGALQIVQAQNWVYGKRRQQWFGLTVGPDLWDVAGAAGSAVGTLRAIADGSLRRLVHSDRWVDKTSRLHALTFRAECWIDAGVGEEVTVTLTLTGSLGSVSATVVCDASDNGTEVPDAIADLTSAMADAGEWVEIEVEFQRTGGSSDNNYVLEISLEEDEQTSSLPDPDDD